MSTKVTKKVQVKVGAIKITITTLLWIICKYEKGLI